MVTIPSGFCDVMDSMRIPSWVYGPIVAVESGGNPNARGDNGASIGLLQINTQVGQGIGHNPNSLFDPATNAKVGGPIIKTAFIDAMLRNIWTGSPDFLTYIATHSGHPIENGNLDIAGVRADMEQLHVEATTWPRTSPFVDVTPNEAFFDSLLLGWTLGLWDGISKTDFAPDDPMTRADMAILVSRAIRIGKP